MYHSKKSRVKTIINVKHNTDAIKCVVVMEIMQEKRSHIAEN